MIVVCAAGNSSENDGTDFFSPASYSTTYPNVIAVAATDSNSDLAYFSNYGTGTVALGRAGNNVFGVGLSGYGYDSGTSMAAPW